LAGQRLYGFLFCPERCLKANLFPALFLNCPSTAPNLAGVLLVASEGLDHSIFRRSVVLLTQHGR
jgi:hypothetical protein